MQDDAFEWDDAKAASNLARHKVSFEVARLAFADAFGLSEEEDRRERYGEVRELLLGMAQGRLLAVVWTQRGKRTRIISARRAEPHESRFYHEENAGD